MITKDVLYIYFLLFILVSTTVINNYFAIFSVAGLIIVSLRFCSKSILSFCLHTLFAFFLSLYLIFIEDISDAIFFVNHISYGYFSVVGFYILSKRNNFSIPRNLIVTLIILSIFFVLLQATEILPSSHFPRLSGFYPNPNQFAVFCLFLLFTNFYKNSAFLLGLLPQSSTFSPLILWSRLSLFGKKTRFLVLFFIVLLFLIFTSQLYFLTLKYSFFWDALKSASSLDLDGIEVGEEYSATKRVFYLIMALNDVTSLASYTSLGTFQFREGFLLSIVSINPLLGILLLAFSVAISLRFSLNHDYIYIFALACWLFVLPFFDPLLILLLNMGLSRSSR